MNRTIVANNIKPILDERVFGFDEVVGAYQYLREHNHVGKVIIDVV